MSLDLLRPLLALRVAKPVDSGMRVNSVSRRASSLPEAN